MRLRIIPQWMSGRRPRGLRGYGPLVGVAAVLTLLLAVTENWDAIEKIVSPAVTAPVRPAARPVSPAPSPSASIVTPPPPASSAPIRLEPILGQPPLMLSPPFEVDDGLTLRTETQKVRLAGLEGPERDAVCLDPTDRLWACGLQARAALYNLIRRSDVTCRRVQPATAPIALAECRIGRDDVGLSLVTKGFARPAGERGVAFRQARETAEREAAGLWNGGWRIRR